MKKSEFMRQLLSQIRSARLRASTSVEIESHIDESASRLRDKGISAEEAEEIALLKLGDPNALGRSIRLANRPYYLRFSFVSALVLGLGIPLFVGSMAYLERDAREMLGRVSATKEKFRAEFFEDQKILAATEFFGSPLVNKRDAGPFLNPRVVWVPRQELPEWPELEFPRPVEKILRTPPGRLRWFELKPDQLGKTDFAWMQKLDQYDHWDLFASPSLAKTHLANGGGPITTPIPNMGQMQLFAKARLIYGFSGNFLSAAKEVRQLARLVYSTENLLGSMVAISLLNIERQAYEEAIKRKLIQPGEWQPYSEEITLRAKRSLYGLASWISFENDPKQVNEFLRLPHSASGLCAAIFELHNSVWVVRPFLEPRVALESDYSAWLNQVDTLVQTSGCRLTYVKASPPKIEPMVWSSDPATLFMNASYAFGSHIPYFRRAYAMYFIQNSLPSFMTPYKNLRLPASRPKN